MQSEIKSLLTLLADYQLLHKATLGSGNDPKKDLVLADMNNIVDKVSEKFAHIIDKMVDDRVKKIVDERIKSAVSFSALRWDR